MIHTNKTEEIIEKIIELGLCLEIEDNVIWEELLYLKNYSWLDRESPNFWFKIAKQLTELETKALMMAMTVLEKEFNWGGGSVSATIWIYQYYCRVHGDHDNRIANWLLGHTKNPYIPFGKDNHGARSVAEYRQLENEKMERYQIHLDRQAQQQAISVLKRRIEKQRQNLQSRLHEARFFARRDYISWFLTLNQTEKLIVVALDVEKPIDYFPIECTLIDDDLLQQLDWDVKQALIDRISDRRKGPWRDLYIRLR